VPQRDEMQSSVALTPAIDIFSVVDTRLLPMRKNRVNSHALALIAFEVSVRSCLWIRLRGLAPRRMLICNQSECVLRPLHARNAVRVALNGFWL
jgi:hypothetical protein